MITLKKIPMYQYHTLEVSQPSTRVVVLEAGIGLTAWCMCRIVLVVEGREYERQPRL